MFSEKKRPEPSQAVHTLLGKGTLWKGEVVAGQNNLRIEGTVEGTITSEGEVTIAPSGMVRGTILAKHLIVTGKVEGIFRIVECLEIHGTGCVEGEVELGSLVVDEGGTLQGTCTRRGVARSTNGQAAPEPAPAHAAPAALPPPGPGRNLEPIAERHPFPAANGATAPDPFAKAFENKTKA
ncbi:bactofilin family protein [Mesoterricola silvestris]|uniref:Polymer-forming cytoskeletal protein n=1 Tax=Mesoterricola silvestris TaxID=2927979 RepID=A0AA48GQ82_9BACT|nr:polymer-forming cytoskeletal protein [Mesoterricola silvestris]BDU73705.1 hypothetical protein METEAL_28790 [Mesoterricola silvestris]